MRIWVLSSGSSGNALVVETANARILVDAGISTPEVDRRLVRVGAPFLLRDIDAIVVTHHHGDHVRSIGAAARAAGVPIFTHRGVELPKLPRQTRVCELDEGRSNDVCGIELEMVRVPHDAPQVALRFRHRELAFGLATDLGACPDDAVALLARCDLAVLEANYCPSLLRGAPYPEWLKARIFGRDGHLGNDVARDVAERLDGSRAKTLVLGHLSARSNTPATALGAVGEGRHQRRYALAHGGSALLHVACDGEPIGEIAAASSSVPRAAGMGGVARANPVDTPR